MAQDYMASFTLVLLLATVIARVLVMRRGGTTAMNFGKIDRKDFLIPPFALAYFYLVFAAAFHWPTPSSQRMFHSQAAAWVGVALCLIGLAALVLSLISFGNSFRVGIDAEHADRLVTTGVFAFSRNPIYVGFALVLVGQFLVFPNWILFVYLIAAVAVFHRQVLREEAWLKGHYGQSYEAYCKRVRRYL